MKKWIAFGLLIASFAASAQNNSDAARVGINSERAKLEATFAFEDTACYKRFLVNDCLDEVKVRRRDALGDLRRQEILLDDESRKAKAADQLQKIEDKSSPEKLQLQADKKAQSMKAFAEATARDKQKNANRTTLQEGEKAKTDASASRAKNNQDKNARAALKQAAATEELRKYNERQAQSKERLARFAKEKANKAKTTVLPLPAPP